MSAVADHAVLAVQNETTGKAKMGLGDLNLLWTYQKEDSLTVQLVIPEVWPAPALVQHSVFQLLALAGLVAESDLW